MDTPQRLGPIREGLETALAARSEHQARDLRLALNSL